ncbi:MAG: hypothetical protein DRI48_10945, partial [Chloroflexi bacterium]
MKAISILNHVLGPIMRGPSSTHTAGSFHIGRLARALLGEEPASVTFAFDPGGSLAEVYRQQGSDLGFAAGVMGWSITDERFPRALELAAERGVQIEFTVEPLATADHPNTVEIRMTSRSGRRLPAVAQSIGGGAVVFTQVDGWPVRLTGDAHEIVATLEAQAEPAVRELLTRDGQMLGEPVRQVRGDRVALHVRRQSALATEARRQVARLPGVHALW